MLTCDEGMGSDQETGSKGCCCAGVRFAYAVVGPTFAQIDPEEEVSARPRPLGECGRHADTAPLWLDLGWEAATLVFQLGSTVVERGGSWGQLLCGERPML